MDEQRHPQSALRRRISRTTIGVSVVLAALVSTFAPVDAAQADDAPPARGLQRLSRSVPGSGYEAVPRSLGLRGLAAALDVPIDLASPESDVSAAPSEPIPPAAGTPEAVAEALAPDAGTPAEPAAGEPVPAAGEEPVATGPAPEPDAPAPGDAPADATPADAGGPTGAATEPEPPAPAPDPQPATGEPVLADPPSGDTTPSQPPPSADDPVATPAAVVPTPAGDTTPPAEPMAAADDPVTTPAAVVPTPAAGEGIASAAIPDSEPATAPVVATPAVKRAPAPVTPTTTVSPAEETAPAPDPASDPAAPASVQPAAAPVPDHAARGVTLDASGIVVQGTVPVAIASPVRIVRIVGVVQETVRRIAAHQTYGGGVTVLSAEVARVVAQDAPVPPGFVVEPLVETALAMPSAVRRPTTRDTAPASDPERDSSEPRHTRVPPVPAPHSGPTSAVAAVASAAAGGGVGAALAVLVVCLAALSLIYGALASAPAFARSVSLQLVVERPG